MNDPIELIEYQPSRVELSADDLAWLLGPGQKRFTLAPIHGDDAWLLSPGSTVGVLVLPSGRRVQCQPKAPVRNVFFMLATAIGLKSPFLDQPVGFTRIDELFDFLVTHLANLIDARLRAGLYRTYLEREENLRAVRGRIQIGEDLRRNAVLRHRTYCQYSELTWDVPENRVIRQTVWAVSRLVQSSALQRRLAALDRTLDEIDPAPLPLSVFDTFHYHRLNDDYRPIHMLCRLLLGGSSVSEAAGDIGFRAFLLDMNRLYESFLAASLSAALPAELSLVEQRRTHLDDERRIAIQPDITLVRAGAPLLIADAKYRLLAGEHTGHADLYQLLAYCTAERIGRGVLIYPRWEGGGESRVRVRNSPIALERWSLDLGGSIADLRGEILQLSARLATAALPLPEMAL